MGKVEVGYGLGLVLSGTVCEIGYGHDLNCYEIGYGFISIGCLMFCSSRLFGVIFGNFVG